MRQVQSFASFGSGLDTSGTRLNSLISAAGSTAIVGAASGAILSVADDLCLSSRISLSGASMISSSDRSFSHPVSIRFLLASSLLALISVVDLPSGFFLGVSFEVSLRSHPRNGIYPPVVYIVLTPPAHKRVGDK